MKVMLLGMMSPNSTGAPPTEEAIRAMHDYNEELQKAGVLVDLGGLMPGARVTFSGGQCRVTDGPFAEAKEVVGGYSILEVKDFAEALEWVKRAPHSGDFVVEVRPLFDPSVFEPK